MLDSFFFAFHAVTPILLLMLLGYWLKQTGFFSEDTLRSMNTFVFRYGLSALMFCNIYSLDSLSDIPVDLMLFSLCTIFLITLLYVGVAMLVTENPRRRGVIVQAGFRSNFGVIGTALAASLCGTEGQLVATGIQAPGIIYFNVAAVLCLTAFSESGKQRVHPRQIAKRIATNPLIIGQFGGLICLILREFIPRTAEGALVFSLSGTLPFLYKPLQSLREMATPLVLVVIGGQMDFRTAHTLRKEIFAGVILRLIVTPLLGFSMAFAAQALGWFTLTSTAAAVLLAFYGSPVAVASAVMAENMGCDGELARQYVVWTNTIGIGTLFLWVMLFRLIGLI